MILLPIPGSIKTEYNYKGNCNKGSGICLVHAPSISTRLRNTQSISLTTCNKPNYDPTQSIKNDALSTFDFLHSAHLVDHRTKNGLTSKRSSFKIYLYALANVYTLYSPLCSLHIIIFLWSPQNMYTPPFPPHNQSLHVFKFSMVSPKSIYPTLPLRSLPLLRRILSTCDSPTKQL